MYFLINFEFIIIVIIIIIIISESNNKVRPLQINTFN